MICMSSQAGLDNLFMHAFKIYNMELPQNCIHTVIYHTVICFIYDFLWKHDVILFSFKFVDCSTHILDDYFEWLLWDLELWNTVWVENEL